MDVWLRLSGWVFVGLLAVTGVVLGLGDRLPEQQSVTLSTAIHSSPERVWALLAEVEREPTWRAGVQEVLPLPNRNGLPCWQERHASSYEAFCVTEQQEPVQRVLQGADPRLPVQERWTFALRPEGDGTRVDLTQDVLVRPAMWRFARRYLRWNNNEPQRMLEDLRRAAETR